MRQHIQQLCSSDHVALFYRNREEQFAAAIPYIQIGLERNERCLYIVSDNCIRTVIDALEQAGVDVAKEQQAKRLTIATPGDTYLKNGIFEPDAMINGLCDEVNRARADGYSCFRATGELLWAVDFPSALLRLHEYEALLDLRFPHRFIGLCQYNETRFHPETISQMLRVHPKIIARGRLIKNPYYIPKAESLTRPFATVSLDCLIPSDAESAPRLSPPSRALADEAEQASTGKTTASTVGAKSL